MTPLVSANDDGDAHVTELSARKLSKSNNQPIYFVVMCKYFFNVHKVHLRNIYLHASYIGQFLNSLRRQRVGRESYFITNSLYSLQIIAWYSKGGTIMRRMKMILSYFTLSLTTLFKVNPKDFCSWMKSKS